MISAQILADSVGPDGHRLTTFLLKYPRFILAQLNTHRVLSKNTASSRAIPTRRLLRAIWQDCAEPLEWGQNRSGMQADNQLSGWRRWLARQLWKSGRNFALAHAWALSKISTHKQVTNRVIEPYSHSHTVISGTEWGNFFNLRAKWDAQPEIRELACAMLLAYESSDPKKLGYAEWHLPFADKHCPTDFDTNQKRIVSVARCARASYANFDGDFSFEKDKRLYQGLIDGKHLTPFEHVATPSLDYELWGNYRGFAQLRKTIIDENRTEYCADQLLEGLRHAGIEVGTLTANTY